MGLLDKAKEKTKGLAGKGKEKLGQYFKDIGGLSPILSSGGFSLNEVDVGLGLPPSVSVGIGCESGSEDSIGKLLEREDLTKTQRALLLGVQKVFGMQSIATKNNFRISGVSVELSIPPSVSMKLTPTENIGQDVAPVADGEETEVPPQ